MPYPIDDLAAYLRGEWSLRRRITSDAVPIGRFVGKGRFDREGSTPGVLHYLETGTLRLDGFEGPASRRLIYRIETSRAQVTFEDGRPFHTLDLHTGVAHAEHPCGDDRYVGRFEVTDGDTWTHTWQVTGPGKAHRIHTVLRRTRPIHE